MKFTHLLKNYDIGEDMMSAIAGIYHVNESVPIQFGHQMMRALSKFPADAVQMWNKKNVFHSLLRNQLEAIQ